MRRAALARTATLAPTKVEVEEAMQKAIFALIKVGELLSVCKYGGARGPGTKSSAKTKVSCGYASTRKRFDWSPKSQDLLFFTDQTVVYDSRISRDSAGCTFVRTFFWLFSETNVTWQTVEKRPARVDKLTSYMRRLNFERPRDPSRE